MKRGGKTRRLLWLDERCAINYFENHKVLGDNIGRRSRHGVDNLLKMIPRLGAKSRYQSKSTPPYVVHVRSRTFHPRAIRLSELFSSKVCLFISPLFICGYEHMYTHYHESSNSPRVLHTPQTLRITSQVPSPPFLTGFSSNRVYLVTLIGGILYNCIILQCPA